MFERFTTAAREVVVDAQSEARALGHDFIGTEHLLLALLNDADGPAGGPLAGLGMTLAGARAEVARVVGRGRLDAGALAAIGVDLDEVRRRVEAAFGPGALDRRRRRCGPGAMPFTARSKRALELALREARHLGDGHIGPEHVLLGLLHDTDAVGAEIVRAHGGDLAWARAVVRDARAA